MLEGGWLSPLTCLCQVFSRRAGCFGGGWFLCIYCGLGVFEILYGTVGEIYRKIRLPLLLATVSQSCSKAKPASIPKRKVHSLLMALRKLKLPQGWQKEEDGNRPWEAPVWLWRMLEPEEGTGQAAYKPFRMEMIHSDLHSLSPLCLW